MSIGKLVRKVERARIHSRNRRLAESLAEKQRPRWEGAGYQRGASEERERMTLLLGIDREQDRQGPREHLIGYVPEQPYVKVALLPRFGSVDFDKFASMDPWRFERVSFVAFRAVKRSWRSGDNIVSWFEWEGPQ